VRLGTFGILVASQVADLVGVWTIVNPSRVGTDQRQAIGHCRSLPSTVPWVYFRASFSLSAARLMR
jgi:hypothetical protein